MTESQKRHKRSEKGRATQKRYSRGEKGRAAQKRYRRSAKGMLYFKRYRQKPENKKAAKAYRQENKVKLRKYHQSWVKKNKKQYQKVQRRAYKKWRLETRYGLTVEKFFKILKKQKQRCAMCQEKFLCSKHTHVDHDHKTGKVRGLLCAACNRGLGFLRDSITIFQQGIRYLKKHQQSNDTKI